MNQEWVSRKNAERAQQRKDILQEIRSFCASKGFLTDEEIDAIMREVINQEASFCAFSLPTHEAFLIHKSACNADQSKLRDFSAKLLDMMHEGNRLVEKFGYLRYPYDNYLDSEPVEFDGDIIITDPCYVMKPYKPDEENDDWKKCGFGAEMEQLGITHYMTRDTIYGDWSCTVFNTDTRRKIGSFCADAGLVSVFLLDEVLKYNPAFDYHINRKWTTALIKNFKGIVQFVVEEEPYEYKGEQHFDYCVRVVGHGINKRSGKPINFVGRQTGL